MRASTVSLRLPEVRGGAKAKMACAMRATRSGGSASAIVSRTGASASFAKYAGLRFAPS